MLKCLTAVDIFRGCAVIPKACEALKASECWLEEDSNGNLFKTSGWSGNVSWPWYSDPDIQKFKNFLWSGQGLSLRVWWWKDEQESHISILKQLI